MGKLEVGEVCQDCLGSGTVWIGDYALECACTNGAWIGLDAWELFTGFFYLAWGVLFDKDLDRQGLTRTEFFIHGLEDLMNYEVYVYD